MNTGKWGERLAAWYLFFHGCRILERNYRCQASSSLSK